MNSAAKIDVEVANVLDVGQILRGDLRDWNVIDVDVLLANQVQQQVERPVIDAAHAHRKGKDIGEVGRGFAGVRLGGLRRIRFLDGAGVGGVVG